MAGQAVLQLRGGHGGVQPRLRQSQDAADRQRRRQSAQVTQLPSDTPGVLAHHGDAVGGTVPARGRAPPPRGQAGPGLSSTSPDWAMRAILKDASAL